MMAIARLVLGLSLVAGVAGAAAGASTLGPGRGAWRVESPERHGISEAAMRRAAELIRTRAAERYCLVVVKNGAIIHESYFANTSESVYETDSMAKTFTAALIGVAVERGDIDIDTPLREYSVVPHAKWNTTGVDYFENVTARNLLSMSSGYGIVPPGSHMTYSSGAFTQELSYLLSAATNVSGGAIEFASDEFAVPLGIPELYAYDGVGEQISAAGGQMVSCREGARVGQLIVNGGKWLDEQGKEYQMASKKYLEQLLEPAVPGVIDGYGFLTWLNTDMKKETASGEERSHCCGPRWGHGPEACGGPDNSTCGSCCKAVGNYTGDVIPCDPVLPVIPESETQTDNSYQPSDANTSNPSMYVVNQMIGDSFPTVDQQKSPERLGVAMGQYAKYLYVLPEENLTVVTMGQSMGQSLDCEAYSDIFTLSLIWRSLRTALDSPNMTLAREYEERHLKRRQHAPEEEEEAESTVGKEGALSDDEGEGEEVQLAGYLGTPRAEGDRTRASIRADKERYAAEMQRQETERREEVRRKRSLFSQF
jgi:CubicO group peptidase (beta-lactamase class C family)